MENTRRGRSLLNRPGGVGHRPIMGFLARPWWGRRRGPAAGAARRWPSESRPDFSRVWGIEAAEGRARPRRWLVAKPAGKGSMVSSPGRTGVLERTACGSFDRAGPSRMIRVQNSGAGAMVVAVLGHARRSPGFRRTHHLGAFFDYGPPVSASRQDAVGSRSSCWVGAGLRGPADRGSSPWSALSEIRPAKATLEPSAKPGAFGGRLQRKRRSIEPLRRGLGFMVR